jgi:GNAT superfamily N-acetyltransferase
VSEECRIRKAVSDDYPFLADLACQLGYPCEPLEVKSRIVRYLDSPYCAILVAEEGEAVLGWTSLEVVDHFYLPRFAEISGLVVDEGHRGRGLGAVLIAAAGAWASERGLAVLRLKTNVTRKDAHRFYEKLGFQKTKEQYVYMKRLE